MKYLYRIFRLFFCPHECRRIEKINVFDNAESKLPHSTKYISECGRFGKIQMTRDLIHFNRLGLGLCIIAAFSFISYGIYLVTRNFGMWSILAPLILIEAYAIGRVCLDLR